MCSNIKSMSENFLLITHCGLAHLVNDVQVRVFGLSLQLSCPVDESFCLDRILIFHVEPGNFEIRAQLVIHRVLFLTRLQGDTGQHLGSLSPILFTFVDVGKMLSNGSDLKDIVKVNNKIFFLSGLGVYFIGYEVSVGICESSVSTVQGYFQGLNTVFSRFIM